MYLYIETDGEVYLVEKQGKLTLPDEKDKLPFEVKEVYINNFPEGEVRICSPILDKHPTDWYSKVEIPVTDNVSNVAKRAVNFSLPRIVSELIITNIEGKVLMTKNARGLVEGKWKLPGGFISFPENPSEIMIREIQEELGVEIQLGELLGIYNSVKKYPQLFMVCMMYHAKLKSEDFKINKDEISEVAWMDIDEAIQKTNIEFNKLGLQDFKNVGVAQPGRAPRS
jgi:8-oxo-dGTP diphosphatase